MAFPPPPEIFAPAPFGLNIVLRLFESSVLEAEDGGGTEKSARSCDSVSRIRVVMS